jgi:membrane protein
MLQHAQTHSGGWLGAAIGLFTLILGATGTFGSLQDALNRVWHVLTKRLLSFGIIMGLAFLLLVSLALSAILSAVGSVIARYLPKGSQPNFCIRLDFLSSFVVITFILAAIFKILPDARIEWHHVWLYYSSLILLFGAEFTKVWSTLSDGKVRPEPGAVRIEVVKHHQRV